MTLYELWQSRGGALSTGVAMLPPGLVTTRIWVALRTCAATGEQPSAYLLGKLGHALSKVEAADGYLESATALFELPPHIPEAIPPESLPDDLNRRHPLWPQVVELSKQHSHYHAKMVETDDDDTRGECAVQIMENIIPEIDRLCDLIRSGAEVDAAPRAKEKKPDALRQLLSLRSRVSKLPKMIASAKTSKKKQEYEEELETKKAKIAELETQDV